MQLKIKLGEQTACSLCYLLLLIKFMYTVDDSLKKKTEIGQNGHQEVRLKKMGKENDSQFVSNIDPEQSGKHTRLLMLV